MSDKAFSKGNVSALAQTLWEQAGQPVGRDLEFWLAAEKQIQSPPLTATNRLDKGRGGKVPAEKADSTQPVAAVKGRKVQAALKRRGDQDI